MTPPTLRAETLTPAAVDQALAEWGGFSLEVPDTELSWRAALAAARAFFTLPQAEKTALGIDRSRHFRGWSEMHNERDWREQLHLGRERSAPDAAAPPFARLEGPNLWPPDPAFRAAIGVYMGACTALGERILGLVTHAMALDGDPFARVGTEGYLVMKLIGYHPQASKDAMRPGVAPHVDFSWLTLTLQDNPGLEVRARDGGWTLIEPHPGTLWVHGGELLQFATGGRYLAAPHRVVNRSVERARVSIPLFVNPPLTATVPVLTRAALAADDLQVSEHVHRVLGPDVAAVPFHFGESEWRRKGLNAWCAVCAPPPY